MASIDIQHPHTMNPAHARQAVQEVADKLAERFGVEYRWNGDILDFTRSGLDVRIALLPGQLLVNGKLGFLVGALKGPIESEIRRVLGERFF